MAGFNKPEPRPGMNEGDMMSKYIDLYEAMDEDIVLAGRERAAVVDALRWLDEHADQTPGRTITESEHVAFKRDVFSGKIPVDKIADHLGISIVPDPEPTNLQLLSRAIRDWDEGRGEDMILARHLDAIGVKAPEANDE